MSDKRRTEIQAESPFLSAWELALHLLSRRDYFSQELARKLDSFDPEIVEAVIAKATELGYINEERLIAKSFELNHGAKSISFQKLRCDLIAKGANPEMLLPYEVTEDSPLHLLSQNGFSPDFQSDLKSRMKTIRKASGFLARRGFSPEEVESAIEKYFKFE